MGAIVRVVIVSGYKDSGKTAVVEGLVEEFGDRGYRVGTVKHISQENFTIDQPKSDTWRHMNAGSEVVIALSSNETAVLRKGERDLDELLRELMDLDFVILEGFKNVENMVRIVVARDESDVEKLSDEFTIGIVGDIENRENVFDLSDTSAIADLVERKSVMPVGRLDCGSCGYSSCREFVLSSIEGEAQTNECVALKGSVYLSVDGKRIPLKPFVKDLISDTIIGIVSSLKDTEGEKIEIKVEKNGR